MGECDGGKIGQVLALIASSREAIEESRAMTPDERETIDGCFERHFWRMLRDEMLFRNLLISEVGDKT
jgi:hypothetical protein